MIQTTVDVTPMLLATIPSVSTHAPVKMDLMEMEPIALVFIFTYIGYRLHKVRKLLEILLEILCIHAINIS